MMIDFEALRRLALALCNDIAYSDDCKKAMDDAIDTLAKYKWHDLRKNPKDLPEDEGDVLVSLDGKFGCITYVHGIDMTYYDPDRKQFYYTAKDNLVEAWKYIEQFEVNT